MNYLTFKSAHILISDPEAKVYVVFAVIFIYLFFFGGGRGVITVAIVTV